MKWLSSLRLPRTDWIQVEVSSYCNGACVYCPHTVYRDTWSNRHMPLATFEKLLSDTVRTRLFFLQGWGEPLLNPDFFTMLSMAKKAGYRVGTATNGMCLDCEKCARLLEREMDVIAFSLAGTDEKNDAIRKGTTLQAVLDAIRALNRSKEKLAAKKPAVHIAYMLLRSGLADIEKLPTFLRGLGVSEVVVSTLDFVPSGEFEDEALIPATEAEYDRLRSRLDAVAEEGQRYGVNIHYYLPSPIERRVPDTGNIADRISGSVDSLGFSAEQMLGCMENVQRALFVAADGAVSPCVFANLPVSSALHVVRGMECPYERIVFGNINEQSLASIWRHKPYAAFRRNFPNGRLVNLCKDCPKLCEVY